MKVFDKRPLSLILCILLGSFVFFTFGDETARIVLISVSALLIIIPPFISKLSRTQKFKLASFAGLILLASLLSYLYFNLWYYADKRFEEKAEIEGTVESFNFSGGTNTLVLEANSIDGASLSEYKIKVILEDNDITNITTGTKIRFEAELKSFTATSDFDATAYYYSRGFSAQAENVEKVEIIGEEETSLSRKIADYRQSLARRLVINSSRENGGLLAALLLGEREYLNEQIELDFSRIGISHILALSGMHLAILCQGISRLLKLFGMGKIWRKLLEMLFVIAYMTLTGFPVSVVRAGLMVIISSFLFLLSSSKDSVTNLFLSVTLIVLAQPYSIFDMSLWLSAFATLGTIISFEILENHLITVDKSIIKRLLISVSATFLTSIFAICSTLAITYFYFNSISSLSLISTIIFSPIFLIFTYLGTFFLFTASFIPLGDAINAFGNFITGLAHEFSSGRYSLLSTDFPLARAMITLSTLSLVLFLVLDIRKRKTATLVVSLTLIASILCSGICTANANATFGFEYSEYDGRERILMKKDSESTLIEISTLTNKVAYETLSYLEENHILYLDNYFVTSYNSRSLSSIEVILSGVFVKNLYVPAPSSPENSDTYSEILKLGESYKIDLIFYQAEEMLEFSDFTVFPVYYDKSGRVAMCIDYQNELYTYVSANMLDTSAENIALKLMNGANTVIIGAKGESSDEYSFAYKIPGDTKLIYNKESGLTDAVLKYYENRIVVDPNGRMDLYVE